MLASKTLAVAFFLEGKYVQAFPSFGAERRGAPVAAYTRVDDEPIRLRNYVYTPDHIVVLDPTLLEMTDVAEGMKKDGFVILNTPRNPGDFKEYFPERKLSAVDASAIAVKHGLGTPTAPIVNTAILGAFAKATNSVKIESIAEAIRESVPAKAESNVAAAMEAYEKAVSLSEK